MSNMKDLLKIVAESDLNEAAYNWVVDIGRKEVHLMNMTNLNQAIDIMGRTSGNKLEEWPNAFYITYKNKSVNTNNYDLTVDDIHNMLSSIGYKNHPTDEDINEFINAVQGDSIVEADYDHSDAEDYDDEYDDEYEEDAEQGPYVTGAPSRNSYWNNRGKYQTMGDELHDLLPASGEVTAANSQMLERFRSISNVYYDVYNNGGYDQGHGQRHEELAYITGWGEDETYTTEELEYVVDEITLAAYKEQKALGNLGSTTESRDNMNESSGGSYAEEIAQDLVDSGYVAKSEDKLASKIVEYMKYSEMPIRTINGLMLDQDFLSDTISYYNYLVKQGGMNESVRIDPITDFTLDSYDTKTANRVMEILQKGGFDELSLSRHSNTNDIFAMKRILLKMEHAGMIIQDPKTLHAAYGVWFRSDSDDPRVAKQSIDEDEYDDMEFGSGADSGYPGDNDAPVVKYGVYAKGGSIGSNNDQPIRIFDKVTDAKEFAKMRRKNLSPGERKYYGMGYVTRKIKPGETPMFEDDGDSYSYQTGDMVEIDPALGGEAQVVAVGPQWLMVKLPNGKLKAIAPKDAAPIDNGGPSRDYNPDDESTEVDYDDDEPESLDFNEEIVPLDSDSEFNYIDDETGEVFIDNPSDEDESSLPKKRTVWDDEIKSKHGIKPLALDALGTFADIAAGGGDPIDVLINDMGYTIDDINAEAKAQGWGDAHQWADSVNSETVGESFGGIKKGFKKGMKTVKRSFSGWDGMTGHNDPDDSSEPFNMMRKHADASDEQLQQMAKIHKSMGSDGPGSVTGLSDKLTKRQLRKRGLRDFEKHMKEGRWHSDRKSAFKRREQNAGLDQDPQHPDDARRSSPYGGGPSSRDENDRPDWSNPTPNKVMVTIDGRKWKSMPRAQAAKVKQTLEARGKKVTLTMEAKQDASTARNRAKAKASADGYDSKRASKKK